MLGREIPGLLPVNPEGGKIARAAAVSPLIEAGNIYLPHPLSAPWVNGFIEECAAFPNGAHDDQVDAMTQALLRWNLVTTRRVIYYQERYQISPI
jgi:predicted phage terminase large subunit-like protein